MTSDIKLAHSFTSLKAFDNCPKWYYHERITKEVKQEPGTATVYGERVHKQLEDHFNKGTPLPEETAKLQPICDVLKAGAAGGGMLIAEQEYTLTRDLKPCGWFDKDAWLRSKLDVLVIKNDGSAVVVDWKTGKRKPDFDQLELFALQVMSRWPSTDKVKSMFVWTQDMKTDHQTYRREHMDGMWASLFARTNRIERAVAENNWPAKPSGLCRYCPCRTFCEFAA